MDLAQKVKKDQEEFMKQRARRLKEAAEYVEGELKAAISQPGSKGVHAAPGQPPLKQSGKLVESIQIRYEGNEAVVFSDSPYIRSVQSKGHPFWAETCERCEPKMRDIIFDFASKGK